MMTLWRETQQIETHLLGTADTGNALLFEARMLLDDNLADKVLWQQRTYNIVRQYGRQQLKTELEEVHQQLFETPRHQGFAQRIRALFSKK
nr:hypothetical protein [uncultured Mucilaginibacter sp.]